MPILRCPNCGAKLRVDDSAMGKTKRCPQCQELFTARVQPVQSRYDEFLRKLPIKFPLTGYWVTISPRSDNRIDVEVSEETADDPLPEMLGTSFELDAEQTDRIKAFLAFYLHTPTGPEMFLWDQRLSDIDFWGLELEDLFEAWSSLKQPLDDHGRLQIGINCLGFSDFGSRCGNVTKDPSGLCRVHNKPDAKTIWNSLQGLE